MNKYLLLATLIIAFASCRKLVQDEFNNFDNINTINAYIAADSIIKIHFSQTRKLDNNPISTISDAEVKLYINDLEIIQPHIGNGIYSSNTKAPSQSFYKCVVNYGNSLSTSSCVIPPVPVLNSIELHPAGWVSEEGLPSPLIEVNIANNSIDTMYFEAYVYVFSKDIYEDVNPVYWFSEKQSAELFTNFGQKSNTFTHQIKFSLDTWGSSTINAYILELRALNKEAYEYLRSFSLYELGRYPEFGTGSIVPYNIYGNIENGKGIFAGYASIFTDTLYETTPEQP